MENMSFDTECRLRVKKVLTNRMTVTDAITELNKKYGVSKPWKIRNIIIFYILVSFITGDEIITCDGKKDG